MSEVIMFVVGLQTELDKRMGCSWHVIVGEEFGFDVTYEIGNMIYIFYGSLGLLLFKCGTQLLSETDYKPLHAETDIKKKSKIDTEKYQKIIY